MNHKPLEEMTEAERKLYYAMGSVECPQCKELHPWLSQQGASVDVHGKCLACLLFKDYPHPFTSEAMELEADAKVQQVVDKTLEREQWTGRRVFPCPTHKQDDCRVCGSKGWILGRPPGYKNMAQPSS